jgi:hypothetical protein
VRDTSWWRPVLTACARVGPASGDAAEEVSSLKLFLPTEPFLRALDPSILLVRGDRGAGKTALFNALRTGGFGPLRRHAPALVRAYGDERWSAVPVHRDDFPDQVVAGMKLRRRSMEELQLFWVAMLVRALHRAGELAAAEPAPWRSLAENPALTIDDRIATAGEHLEAVMAALGALDQRLRTERRKAFVCYDDLDRLMPEFVRGRDPVGALLALWYAQRHRWQALLPKVFLRVDLFDDVQLAFPDASKFFAGHQTELRCDRLDAWRMWLKRMLNQDDPERNRLVRAWTHRASTNLALDDDEDLGVMPGERRPAQLALAFSSVTLPERRVAGEEHIAPLVEALVGEYMGSGPRKGLTFTWVPQHVEDANGRLLPRSFLHMMRAAGELALARLDLADPGPAVERPMSPADLVNGLARASEYRLADLCDEDPWIRDAVAPLSGREVPASEAEWLGWLEEALRPGGGLRAALPPEVEAEDVLRRLCRRGVVEPRPGTFTVPELYRAALKVKRRGGPRRRAGPLADAVG